MDFSINSEERGMFFLIDIDGEFTLKTLRTVRDRVEEALGAGHIFIAFDFTDVRFIDSGGTGLIANLHKRLKAEGGSTYLVGVNAGITESLRMHGILETIEHFSTLEEAEKKIG